MSEAMTIPVLPCVSLPETLAFYAALGFEVTHQQTAPNVYAATRRGEVHLHFMGLKGLDPGQAYSTCLVIVPEVERLHETFAVRAEQVRLAHGGDVPLVAAALHLRLELRVRDRCDGADTDARRLRERLEERRLLRGGPAPAPGVHVDRAGLGDRPLGDDQGGERAGERNALEEPPTAAVDAGSLRHGAYLPHSDCRSRLEAGS